MKTTKFLTVPLTALSLLVSGLGFVPTRPAEAALSAVGPVLDLDANGLATTNGFPAWFADENGLKLKLCLDQNPAGLCILTPEFDPATPGFSPIGNVSGGALAFPDESFYWLASADLSPANVRLAGANQDIKILWFAALEQAFLSGVTPGGQSIFLRSQVDIGGLVPGATYNFTTPYGPMSVVADAQGGGRTRFEDIVGCNVGFACNFAPILPGTQTNVGAFLQWDGTLPAPPAGFIGDPNVLHTISGGQGGVNTLTVTGTSVGGVGIDSASTNLFSVSGQLFAPVIKEVTPVATVVPTNTNAYTFNSNDAGPITVGGSCSLAAPVSAVVGNNTITLTTTTADNSASLHDDCTVTVTNTAVPPQASNVLAVKPFTVDTRPPFISAINVTPVADVVKVGTTKQLSAAALDQFSNPITSEALTWSSSNTAVGTVDANGMFTAVGTGSTTITAANAAGTVVATTVVNANTLVISDIRVINKKKDRVTITWTTTVPSTDMVKTATKKKGSKLVSARTTRDGQNVTTHTATVTRLKKNTKYFFQVTSTDGVTTVKSPIKTFTTKRK